MEAGVLELVQCLGDGDHRVPLGEIVDDRSLPLFGEHVVDVRVVLGQQVVEQHSAHGGVRHPRHSRLPALGLLQMCLLTQRRHHIAQPDPDLGLQSDGAAVQRHQRLGW